MAVKITVFNQKGGVGKSTTAKAVAGDLAMRHNKRVLLIDCDPSANLTMGLGVPDGAKPQMPFARILLDYINYGDENDIHDAIVPTVFPNIDLVPMHRSIMIKTDSAVVPEDKVFDVFMGEVEEEYDFIIIDVGSNDAKNICMSALYYTEYILVPFEAGTDSILGYQYVLDRMQIIEPLNPKIKILGCFINKYRGREMVSRFAAENGAGIMGENFMETTVRQAAAVENARNCLMPICYYDKSSEIAKDFRDLTAEILRRIEK